MPKGNADTNRSAGGPGSSHQGGNHGEAHREKGKSVPGPATNSSKSQVSGGGGERDSHHTHDPELKGDRTGY
ncbi:MAG TPA: hypothetical protein VIL69_15300 [Roseomonas sp.]|jgi:hypothetical protein